MKPGLLTLCLLSLLSISMSGQPPDTTIAGHVSFISSQNIYVRFTSTRGINIHDTLFSPSAQKLVPVLVVNNLSSTSCICSAISDEDLPVGHLIMARAKREEKTEAAKTLEELKNEIPAPLDLNKPVIETKSEDKVNRIQQPAGKNQSVTGRISAASYSDLSNTAGRNIQRFRYNLSVNALNIGGSKFSAETYISFRHRAGKWVEVRNDIFNALKIYSLALKYEPISSMRLILGRQINPRVASIGSFDGIVIEKSIKRFSAGITGGTRPDFRNYGFNKNLIQYGAYVSYDYSEKGAYTGTSVAFMEQLYSGKTDRRFMYLQHSGSLLKNLNLFSSFEIDIFRLRNNKPETAFDLTSFYTSLNYRISDKVTLNGSYDARKNPVYYETFKTFADSLINTGIRQSWRLGSNIRVTNNLMLGIQSSFRFLKADINRSKNIMGFLTYSIPGNSYSSVTVSGNYIESNNINGINGGIGLINNISKGKIQTGIGYNYQDYRLPEGRQNLRQHTGKADLYWQIAKKTSFSLNYEITYESGDRYNRLYLQVTKRF